MHFEAKRIIPKQLLSLVYNPLDYLNTLKTLGSYA